MDDVTMVAASLDHVRVLAVALWEWYWRSRFVESYPGHPRTFVATLGPRAKSEAATCGEVFTFEMSALRAARRVDGHDVTEVAAYDAVISTISIHEGIRVLGVRFHRWGRWSKFVESLAKNAAG